VIEAGGPGFLSGPPVTICLRVGHFRGCRVLRLVGEQVESLFDEALPIEVRELPEELARLDVLLSDPALLAPIAARWDAEARERGRPTIAMALLVRLMVIKQRTGWGYETLVREVSDSLHLRRFCGLSLTASVPHESTVRKLVRRLGPQAVEEITRVLIDKAQRERRFTARAMRCDSTVVEADVRWPSDAALALDAARRLAREGARAAAAAGEGARRVRNRSRAVGRRLRLIGRTMSRRLARTGGARALVLELTGQAGELVRQSIREARALAAQTRRRARGRGARAKLIAARRLDEQAELAETVCRQISQRLAGEKIPDRLVSLADPDARPIGKGKLGKRYEFGYVFQLAELTPNTRRGARGLILRPPARSARQMRASCCRRPSPSWTGSRSRRAKSRSMAALHSTPPTGTFQPPRCSSRAASTRPRAGPRNASRATARAPRAASATSNAATACAAAGSEATTARGPGPAGRS